MQWIVWVLATWLLLGGMVAFVHACRETGTRRTGHLVAMGVDFACGIAALMTSHWIFLVFAFAARIILKQMLNSETALPASTSTHPLAHPIFRAVADGDYHAVRLFLAEDRSLVHAQDPGQNTPLHYAAEHGQTTIVELLLSAGAQVNAINQHGMTALHWAADRGNLRMVQALVKAGASVSTLDQDGETPVQMAALHGHLQVAAYLSGAG
jgi:hypothetical protein